ncbi:hypothetical protein [Amycolatopsis sp. NPDC004625]|uniref:hypothetical protein n=1 Tax=Amycolatopsis sp. NPDC004625 TaxID=3154670 RepID=UPI0033AD2615
MTTDLDHWRDHPERWPELAYAEARDEDGDPADAHHAAREAVLRLLLRDRRDTDAVFLRYLLDQEIRYHDAGWGYDDSLGLAALLLSECGEADDVWQLSEAKYTNFDTSGGLDAFLLFPAGVAATLEHVERSDHPDRDDVSADLREHLVHDPGLDRDRAARLAGLREHYSA